MRIVVTGINGQVAQSMAAQSSADIEIVPVGRPGMDFEKIETIGHAVVRQKPDVIVNAAAFTAVDKAEDNKETAWLVNAEAAGEISATARALDVPVVHISTDYVFDGRGDRAYVETDPVGPISVYGRSKLAGEQAVAEQHADHVILRTAWVFSPYGNNFLKTMLRLGETNDGVRVVADQRGTPTYALDIAKAVIAIASRLRREPNTADLRGIFHLTNSGQASWADFAEAIFTEAQQYGRKPVSVSRITTDQYPTRASRPANSQLNCDKLFKTYGLRLPAWQIATRDCINRLIGPNPGSANR